MTHNIRPFPGASWDADKQLLRYFRPGRLTVLSLWPKPWAVEKDYTKGFWTHCRPMFLDLTDADYTVPNPRPAPLTLSRVNPGADKDILAALDYRMGVSYVGWEDAQARAAASKMVPQELRSLIISRYEYRQFHLLSFLGRCPGAAEDLVRSNSALAFCWASCWCFKRIEQPLRAARAWLKHRQREQLEWLGFPGTEAAVKVLRRVSTKLLGLPAYLYLRQALREESILRRLSFLPRINASVIRVISDPALAVHASQNLLSELGLEDLGREDFYGQLDLMRDTVAMADEARYGIRGLVFQGREHLWRVHQELVEELRGKPGQDQRLSVDLPAAPFPAALIPGVVDIQPLSTGAMIADWSRSQHNCIESCYLERVAQSGGRAYLYQLLYPEPATLYIELGVGNKFRIRALRGVCNQKVRPETLKAAKEWLKRVQNKLPGRSDEGFIPEPETEAEGDL